MVEGWLADVVDRGAVISGLAGKAAIIWGGGAGMGLATARVLARSGCRVALVDRDGKLARSSAAALAEQGFTAIGLTADVTEEADVIGAVEAAARALGPITRSASVVGIADFRPAIEMTLDQWNQAQKINLLPMFLIGRTMARHIRDAGESGSLAFVSSVSGLTAAHGHSSYGAAKRAMSGLAQSFAGEWGPLGIRVNLVAPGATRTDRIGASSGMDEVIARRLPAGRMAEVEELANCIAFVLSDMASYVTGHNLVADGGFMTVPALLPSDNPKLG